MIASGVHKGNYLNDIDFGEDVALCFGLYFASKIDLSPLIVKLDSLFVVCQSRIFRFIVSQGFNTVL